MYITGTELVELGIQIEKNGRDFYRCVSDNSKDKKAKEIFIYLAGEEEKHITDFQKILESVHRYEPEESYPEEYFAYMNALASDHVFTQKGKETAEAVKSDREAVDIGIKAEKDSIIFYEGMRRIVPGEDRSLIDALITQEQNHLKQLLDFKFPLPNKGRGLASPAGRQG